jgi:hypothetical protein
LQIAGKPKLKIIKERKLIIGRRLEALIKILERPTPDSEVIVHARFERQHAIFIIKNGTTSYVDICFTCLEFEKPKEISKIGLSNTRKWQELDAYFRSLGFKYEL